MSVTYTADGVQREFSFPFDYLRRSFVYVEVNEETMLTQGTEYTVYEKNVIFTAVPQMGTVIRIFRQTDTKPLVSWADASVLRAKDMTIQQIQSLHLLEEQDYWVRDNAMLRNGKEWDGRGYPIVNIAQPDQPDDAATKRYIDNLISSLQALGSEGVIFNTVADMRVNRLLVPGQTAMTKGYLEIYDSGASIYNIRAKTYSDRDDGKNIVILGNNNVAERIAHIGVTNFFELDEDTGALYQIVEE